MVTPTVENYLKAIYRLQQSGSPATTNAVAERLGLRAASVTAMLQQLSDQGLADYTPYRGAFLTEAGLAAALRVIRRHRLIELYLHQHLDVPWDHVHDEAERLEHAISPYLEERIDARLGYPQFDPHGAPIPTSTGEIPAQDLVPLYDLPIDTASTVRHIPDDDPALLRYVASLGLTPNARVKITERAPFDGPITVSVMSPGESESTRQVVGATLARGISVSRPGADEGAEQNGVS
jgi:DtxR family transcriptional regulator, Mn-dependent transcriptional regulator